jgi:hypothetical protein
MKKNNPLQSLSSNSVTFFYHHPSFLFSSLFFLDPLFRTILEQPLISITARTESTGMSTPPTHEEVRSKKEQFALELKHVQDQEDESTRQAALLHPRVHDGQTAETGIARADAAEKLAVTRQENILEINVHIISLELEIVLLQNVSTAQVAEQNVIVTDNQTLGSIVISVTDERGVLCTSRSQGLTH